MDVKDIGSTKKYLYVIMEFCDGNDLDALMKENLEAGRIISEYKAI